MGVKTVKFDLCIYVDGWDKDICFKFENLEFSPSKYLEEKLENKESVYVKGRISESNS